MPTTAYGKWALEDELGKLSQAAQGNRNNTLNNVWFKICQLIDGGHVERVEAESQVLAKARQIGLPDSETRATMGSAARGAKGKPRESLPDPTERPPSAGLPSWLDLPRDPSLNGHVAGPVGSLAPVVDAPPPVSLPEAFWASRTALERIRAAAWSRGRSPEAVLGAALARVAADTLHSVKLPATVGARCGLSFITALTGPPGSGKSSSKAAAIELLPARILEPVCDDVPPGSGEGLIEILFDWEVKQTDDGKSQKVKVQKRHNVFAYADEGEILARQAKRDSANTILPIMRTVFTDGTLGQANASEERKRRVAGGQYVYGIVLAIQPGKAGALFDDAGGGTPQRFLWMPTDSHVPPPGQRPQWPGKLERKPIRPATAGAYTLALADPVRHQLEQNDYQRQQHGVSNELDVHADLVRLKVAGILAVLDGRLDVNEEDWSLAGQVMQVSDQTRQRVVAALAQQRAQYNQARGRDVAVQNITSSELEMQAAEQRVLRRLLAIVKDKGETTYGEARKAIAHRDRGHVGSAVAELVRTGQLKDEMRPKAQGEGSARWLVAP